MKSDTKSKKESKFKLVFYFFILFLSKILFNSFFTEYDFHIKKKKEKKNRIRKFGKKPNKKFVKKIILIKQNNFLSTPLNYLISGFMSGVVPFCILCTKYQLVCFILHLLNLS